MGSTTYTVNEPKTTITLKPIGDRIVIEIVKRNDTKTASGILTTSEYEKTEELHGTVIAVGKDVQELAVGQNVSVPGYGYDTITDNSGELHNWITVRERDVLAVITN